eukprot:TRINITY_DN25127_c0_g1_i2.p1 TRINITY_DN25127_c0_g1~~TRINITY_DN25127_c0_g1_i2.p1  ORF type:complete len:234 (-),score=55.86 TRINITY_DN25127_c0_g1_i2:139-840(-)
MLRSLVGSEMCIRDRQHAPDWTILSDGSDAQVSSPTKSPAPPSPLRSPLRAIKPAMDRDRKKGEGRARKDRFIPRRADLDLDLSLFNLTKSTCSMATDQDDYDKALSSSLLGTPLDSTASGSNDPRLKHRVLSFSGPLTQSQLQENERAAGSIWSLARRDRDPLLSTAKVKPVRYIPQAPERILDAPELLDDFYLNLLDWSQRNVVAIALGQTVYLWNATTGGITQLLSLIHI